MSDEEILKVAEAELNIVELKFHQLQYFEETEKKYERLQRLILEFMGYEDEFLITEKGLKKFKKDDLAKMVLEQRNMIRKLIDDLEPEKRDNHLNRLDDLYLNKP